MSEAVSLTVTSFNFWINKPCHTVQFFFFLFSPPPLRVYRAGSSSSWLEPNRLSWGSSSRLGDKVKIRAWLGLGSKKFWIFEPGLGSEKMENYELSSARARGKWKFRAWQKRPSWVKLNLIIKFFPKFKSSVTSFLKPSKIYVSQDTWTTRPGRLRSREPRLEDRKLLKCHWVVWRILVKKKKYILWLLYNNSVSYFSSLLFKSQFVMNPVKYLGMPLQAAPAGFLPRLHLTFSPVTECAGLV